MKVKLMLVCAMVLAWLGMAFLFTPVAHADSCNSTGDGNWGDAVWSCGHTPGAGDDVTITTAITMTTDVSVSNLTVNGKLNFKGRILTFAGAGSLAGTGKLTTGTIRTGASGTVVVTLNGPIETSSAQGLGPAAMGTGTTFETQGSGAFDLTALETNGEIRYVGGTQTITDRNYNNLQITGSGTKSWALGGTRNVLGFLRISSGTLALSGANTLNVGGDFSADSTFNAGDSTINFNGTGFQKIQGSQFPTFNNLTIANSVGVSQTQIITVTGSLMVTSGGTYSTQSVAHFKGNFTNNGTFAASGSKIYFDGAAPQTIGGANSATFGIVEIWNTSGVTLNQHETVGEFRMSGGTFSASAYNLTMTGNWNNYGGTFNAGSGTVNFNGGSPQFIGGGGSTMFNNLTISNSTGVTLNQNAYVQGNWTNNGTFNAGTYTVNFNGTSPQSIGGSSATTFYNLNTSNAAGVVLNRDATVENMLSLTGNLQTGANTLTFNTSSAFIDPLSTGEVIGTVRRTHTFSPGIYYGFGHPTTTIGFNGASPSAVTVTVTVTTTSPSGLDLAVKRTYSIAQTGGGVFSSARVSLHYDDSELNGIPEDQLQLWRYNGTRWVLIPRVGWNTIQNWVVTDGVTEFSDWALTNNGSPNSVILSSFTARADEEYRFIVLATLIGLTVALISATWLIRKRRTN